MNGCKKISIVALSLLLLVTTTNIGTNAFLVNKSSNEKNNIITGQYPKPFVKIYASSGPIYKDYFSTPNDNESANYRAWMSNACSYIISDLNGNASNEGVGSGDTQFKNLIDKGSTGVDRKKDITCETGSFIHNIVVFATPIREGLNLGKINLSDGSIKITQSDVFQSVAQKTNNKPNEYIFKNDDSHLNLSQNKNRIATYDYIEGKYIETSKLVANVYSPAEEADLIIFDAGGIGYSNCDLSSESSDKSKEIEGLISGKDPQAVKVGDLVNIPWTGKMKELVTSQMEPKMDYNCKLDRTECTATFIYQGYTVPIEKSIMYYQQ